MKSDREKRMENAKTDVLYNSLCESHENCARAFREFADAQPAEIRKMLYAYADSGRKMNERLAELAWERLNFLPGEMIPAERERMLRIHAIQDEQAHEHVRIAYRQAEKNMKKLSRWMPKKFLQAAQELEEAAKAYERYYLKVASRVMRFPTEYEK